MNKLQTILFWIDGLKQFEENELYKDLNLNTLNSIANGGCVGQLLYSNKNEKPSRDNLNEFNELLGFKYNDKINEQLFKEKYMNLKIKLISNVDKELTIFSDSVKLEKQTASDLVNNIIKKTNEEMVVIHYQISNNNNSLEERRNALLYLESLMSTLLGKDINSEENNKYYINIVMSYNESNIEIPLTAQQQQQQLANVPNWFNLPKQSYTLENSTIVEPRITSPFFTIHYNQILTRKDTIKSFSETEFINGSNGKILLSQHFRELAFKLGRVPKYGA